MFLESEHDGIFGLAYILSFASYSSDQVDEIIESACDFLRYYVRSPSASTSYFSIKVQFRTISSSCVVAYFSGIYVFSGHICWLCGRRG